MKKDENLKLCMFHFLANKLYLTYTLIEYNMIPKLFICEDIFENYYIAYDPSVEENYYLLSKIDIADIISLMNGNVSILDALLKDTKPIKIKGKGDILYDAYKVISWDDIPKEILPSDDSFYKITKKSDRTFLEILTKESNEKTYIVPVKWLCTGHYLVKAKDKKELKEKLEKISNIANCPFENDEDLFNETLSFDYDDIDELTTI